MIPCPFCNSLCTIPIAYGKPSPEAERAAQRGLLELAGCVTDYHAPTQRCLDCRKGWQPRPKPPKAEFISNSLVMVQKLQDSLSHAMADYGATCVQYGQALGRRSGDQGSTLAQMLESHRRIEKEWTRFYVMAQEYCNHYSGVSDARVYGDFH